jgi:pimeloyl-ACP methyl ester carboxylesterase
VARRLRLVDPHYTLREDLLPYIKHLAGLDLRLFLGMALEAHAHDAFPLLPEIDVPVLIIAAERDTFTPIRLSYHMASTIPDADILVLADASHAALIEQPETINHRVERFLRDRVSLGG